jgi:exopolysaccharide production protein ExoY
MSYSSQLVTQGQALLSSSRRPVGGGIKRAFDFAAACVAIVTLLPLFIACCLLIVATSPGPILFCHRRLGFGGRDFCCLKFRTMQVDADRRLREYLAQDEEARKEWKAHHKLKHDPRITPVGQFLRRTSLDELPQLFNVLLGHMSIVGPRPIVEDEVEKYQENFAIYAAGRPGLTGLWQVKGRNTTTYEQRVAYDVEYLRNWSFLRDIRIILVTVAHVVEGRGAY